MALRWACSRSTAVCVSGTAALELERYLSLTPGTVQVVKNGIRYMPGNRERGRLALGLDDSTPLILAVGNLYPVKGHIYLLHALKALASQHTELPWHAAIAGRGDEEASLQTFLVASGLSDRVTLLGYRDDIPDLLAASDIYTMPSLSEGMPLALLEAMFARKPIVASLVGGIPDVVNAGSEALLVPPKDPHSLACAVMELLNDPARGVGMAAAAEARANAEYGVTRMADTYEKLYWA